MINMQLIHTPNAEILAVDVQERTTDYLISKVNKLLFFNSPIHLLPKSSIDLPLGQWRILGMSDQLTREEARGIVEFRFGNQSEMLEPGYINYSPGIRNGWGDDYILNCDTALESFASLLRSHNIHKPVLILIKK